MKIGKRLLAVILVLTMVITMMPIVAFADEVEKPEAEIYADILNALGLFKGTMEGYELERIPTRVEASVMLVRLLGKEAAALNSTDQHPFTDTPEWADGYISYMYAQGLTKGVSEFSFEPNSNCDGKMFVTFALRALGFDDSKGDFEYDQALNFGRMQQLLTGDDVLRYAESGFKRGDMVIIANNALAVELNGSDKMLIEKLYEEGAVDMQSAKKIIDIIEANDLVEMASYNTYSFSWAESASEQKINISVSGYPTRTTTINSIMKGADLNTNPKISYEYTYSFPDGSTATAERYIVDGYDYLKDAVGNLTKEKYDMESEIESYEMENPLEKYQKITIDKKQDGSAKITITFSTTANDAVNLADMLAEVWLASPDLKESQYMVSCTKYEKTYTINEAGQLTAVEEDLDLTYMEDGDANTYKVNVTMKINYKNIGKTVTVDIPSNLNQYKEVK